MRHVSIIAGGCERARAALEPVIRGEVNAEFAERLRMADASAQEQIRRQIERIIRRRVAAKAPRWALY